MTVYGTTKYNGISYTLYGRPGSTLRDELNRLANGGEYPAYTAYTDEDGAVNKWCNTPPGTNLVKAMNLKASPTRPNNQFKERNAVANELAGMTWGPDKYVEIVTALRTIAS